MRVIPLAALLCACTLNAGPDVPPSQLPVVPPGCAAGLFVRKAADGWECAQPTLQAGAGVVVSSGTTVALDTDKVPLLPSCPAGNVVRRSVDGTGWECFTVSVQAGAGVLVSAGTTVAVDTDKVPLVPTCASGDVVRRKPDDSGWECFTVSYGALPGTPDLTVYARKADVGVAYVRDVRPTGQDGGACTAGQRVTRALNTLEAGAASWISLSNNQLTLTAGSYAIDAQVPFSGLAHFRAMLRRVSDARDVLYGTSESGGGHSVLAGVIVVPDTWVLDVRSICDASKGTADHGAAFSLGSLSEVYTVVRVARLGP